MHIEPGVVEGSKMVLGYATGTGAVAWGVKLAWDMLRQEGALPLVLRSLLTTLLVFGFFEVLPTKPVGVSEVHLILGTTLLLLFGVAPAAIGLAAGLLIQGLFFAPTDLPQYGMNVTTLLVPLYATAALARRVIPEQVAYVDIRYAQAFKLALAYQGGIVAWVAFWALYGHGVEADNLANIGAFGAAYVVVIVAEPLIDLAVLALAKLLHGLKNSVAVQRRLYHVG